MSEGEIARDDAGEGRVADGRVEARASPRLARERGLEGRAPGPLATTTGTLRDEETETECVWGGLGRSGALTHPLSPRMITFNKVRLRGLAAISLLVRSLSCSACSRLDSLLDSRRLPSKLLCSASSGTAHSSRVGFSQLRKLLERF